MWSKSQTQMTKMGFHSSEFIQGNAKGCPLFHWTNAKALPAPQYPTCGARIFSLASLSFIDEWAHTLHYYHQVGVLNEKGSCVGHPLFRCNLRLKCHCFF